MTNERFEDENQPGASSTPSRSRCNKKRVAIAVGSLLVIVAIVVGIVVATGEDNNADSTENTMSAGDTMSCEMSQMESSGELLGMMAPANMDMTNDMMKMDSMTLDCMTEGQEPVVYSKMSSKKVTMDSGATQTIWHGAMTGSRLGFATLVQSPTGIMSGTFTTEDAAYSVMMDPNGTMQMKMTPWGDFPDEEGETDVHETDSSNATEHVVDDTEMTMASSFVPMMMNGTVMSEEADVARTVLTEPSRRFLRQSRKLQANTARVLLLVTNGAMCQYAGLRSGCTPTDRNRAPFDGRVPLLEEEMNNAMQGVGVNAAISIVGVLYIDPPYEGAPDRATLDLIRSNSNVAQWRRDAQADLVAMITGSDGSRTCGVAFLNSPESSTRVDCLDQMTFSHELGHCYGARHDRANNGGQAHPYGHGYQDPGREFRTVMSYNCPGGCPTIPWFSAEGYALSGRAIGTSTENNARLLTENAAQTSNLF